MICFTCGFPLEEPRIQSLFNNKFVSISKDKRFYKRKSFNDSWSPQASKLKFLRPVIGYINITKFGIECGYCGRFYLIKTSCLIEKRNPKYFKDVIKF